VTVKSKTVELDAETVAVLEARAKARGLSIAELIADLVDSDAALSPGMEAMRAGGRGPWAPEILAEDARRLAEFQRSREGVPWQEIKAWMQSWGTANELPPPKSRKL
jgi:hypothetical protein